MKVENISIERLVLPSIEMRETVTREGLEELAQSIKEMGLLQPLTVVRVGDKFEIVAGYRRYEACRLLELSEVPCVVRTATEAEVEEMKIHENLKREDVNPVDEALYYARLVQERGMSVDDIVRLVGRGAAYVEGRLEIAGWDEKTRGALAGGHISIAVGRELMRFRDVEARGRFLVVAVGNGVNARTVDAWRQQYDAEMRRGEKGKAEAVDGAVSTTPTAPRQYCGIGGEDLSGMVVYYLAVCHRCNEWARRQINERAAGGGASSEAVV